MSISDTANARKYASIAEVAAAQAKLSADKLDNAPDYAAQAAASATAAASSAQVAVSAESVVNSLAISASVSATQAAASAAEAGDAAAAAIGQCIRVPEGELISVLPAAVDRTDSFMAFDSSGNTELLSKSDVAILDNTGKIPVSMIPAIAITETYVVFSQAAMLALDAQVGDVAKRTDLGYSFILSANPPSTIANWVQLNDDVLAQLGQSSGAGEVGALTQAGASSTVQSVLDSHVEKTTLASAVGAAMVGIVNGGDVQDAIPEFYVDQFGADPTGATSSTAAVNAALAAINSLTDSRMDKSLSVKYAKLVFGKGTYLVNDILIKSGVHYAGQGAYATLIKPETGTGNFCFTTKNTQSASVGGESVRCFRPVFSDMTIGYDLQRIYSTPIPQDNIGGIYLQNVSYPSLRNVMFNSLDSMGLQLVGVWDGEVDNCHMLKVGNARDPSNGRPSLSINADSNGESCNTIRFKFLHIEDTDYQLYISNGNTLIYFNDAKLEGGKTATTISSIIAGVSGVVFDNPQFSWSSGVIPMIDMNGTNPPSDTNTSDPDNTTSNHARGVIINNPQITDSGTLTGWYFRYESDRGPLQINGGTFRHGRYLVTGHNITINYTQFMYNGPSCIYGTGNVTLNCVQFYKSRVPTSGSVAQIVLTGPNNKVMNSRFYTEFGSSTDGNIWIQSNSTSELWVDNCEFGGSFGNAIQPGSDANARRCTNNKLMTGATYGNLIVGFPDYRSLPSRKLSNTGGSSSISVTVAVDASVPLTNFIGGATLFAARARNSAGAYISAGAFFTDPSGNITEIADLGAKFSVNGGGASGDGQVWLQQSGGTLSVINRTTSSITVTLIGMMAEF